MDEKIKGRNEVHIFAPGKRFTLSLDSNPIFLVLHGQSGCCICYTFCRTVGLHHSRVSFVFLDPR